MRINARKKEYEHIELFGRPALFTSTRIQTDSVPAGWYCYDLRSSDDDPGEPVTIEPYVVINYAESVLTHEKINIPGKGFLRLRNSVNFLDEHLTFQAFYEEHDTSHPRAKRKIDEIQTQITEMVSNYAEQFKQALEQNAFPQQTM